MERSVFCLKDLVLLNDLFVESLFALSTARQLPDDAAWEGVFLLDTKKRSCLRSSFFSRDYLAVFMPHRLQIHGVSSVRVRDGSRIGTYSFEGFTLNNSKLQLKFMEDMDVFLLLDDASSSLLVVNPEHPPYSAKFKYRRWLGIESGPYDLQPMPKDIISNDI